MCLIIWGQLANSGKIFNVVKHSAIQSIAYSKKYPLSLAQATKITCLET